MKNSITTTLILTLAIFFNHLALNANPRDNGLYLSAGLFAGEYDPDLQDKYNKDARGSALISTFQGTPTFGTTTKWSNTRAGGPELGVEYKHNRFIGGLESFNIHSSPEYVLFLSSEFTSLFDLVAVDNLDRDDSKLYAGFLLNPKSSNHKFHILGGFRHINIKADGTRVRYFKATTIAGTASLAQFGIEDDSSADAAGLDFGLRYRYDFRFGMGLEVQFELFALNGTWEQNRIFLGTSTSGFRFENGNYSIFGNELRLKVDYGLAKDLTGFVSFRRQNSNHTDEEVSVVTDQISTNRAAYIQDFLFTYPGSENAEHISGISFGFDYRLDL